MEFFSCHQVFMLLRKPYVDMVSYFYKYNISFTKDSANQNKSLFRPCLSKLDKRGNVCQVMF